jgi:multiple sugar transport system permease protein
MRRLSFRPAAQILVAALFLLPLVWMASAALYPAGAALPQSLRLIPADGTLANFGRIWRIVPLARFTANSLLTVAIAVPLTLVSGSWAGLAMARLPRRAQQRWVVISLAVLMVPSIALWSTRFFVFRELGLLDSVWALAAPAIMGASPFYVLMFYRAFRRIPRAIFEAALLDGAGMLQTWLLVAMPMARATTIGVAVLSFVFFWGDFISPLLYLQSERLYTLPVALQLLQQLNPSDWGVLMAAAVWATLVPVLLFMLAQPWLTRSARD